MFTKKSKENGQILVLVVVGLVGLLGFTSLAIDGGIILSDRRFDQAAADAASLAGAQAVAQSFTENRVNRMNFSCSSADVQTAMDAGIPSAITSALQNTFTIDNDISDGHGVVVTCDDDEMSVSVRVLITQTVITNFAHLFYDGEIKNTVESVVKVFPMHDVGFGNTIVALDEECQPPNKVGATFDGTLSVRITAGGVWSNSCMSIGGTSLLLDASPDGSIIYHEGADYQESGSPTINPDPQTSTEIIETFGVGAVQCNLEADDSYNNKSISGIEEIEPGNYGNITVNTKDDFLVMKPGLYCLKGNFEVKGGSVIASEVTIYVQKPDPHHDAYVSIGGNAGAATPNTELGTIQMTAPGANCSDWLCPPAIEGMLIYMDPSNEGNITLQGNSASEFGGTVYAPTGSIDLGGTSNSTTTMGIQAIANTVKVHGTVQMTVYTDADNVFLAPASLDHTQ